MSAEKMTVVRIPKSAGYAVRGHVSRSDAIAEAERHYARQLAEAQNALEAIRSGRAQVFQQRGIYRVTDRRELVDGSPEHGRDA